MQFQERIFPVAILFVLGICCIGAYVAVSGFMLASPNGPDLSFLNSVRTTAAFNAGTVTSSAERATRLPGTSTPGPTAVSAATLTITPVGFKPSATPSPSRTSTEPPIPAALPNVTFAVTRQASAPGPQPGQTTAPTQAGSFNSACGFEFCPQPGPPDANLGPTHQACPSGYLWGQAYDENGKGVGGSLGWKVVATREGSTAEAFPLKTRPDPEGIWNVATGGGGSWTLQLLDGNNRPLSSKYGIAAGNVNGPGGTCGTRVDFKKAR